MKKLPDAYGSPPGRPGKYALYISRHGDDDTQCMCLVYAAAYAVRRVLDMLLQGGGFLWENDCTIRGENGVVVSTRWFPDRMKRAVEHELTPQEMAWDPSPVDRAAIHQFLHGPEKPRSLEQDSAASHRREKRERRQSAPKADAPPGYVHVSDVATSLGIDAKQARVALRKIYGDDKPKWGWWFDPKDLESIKSKIKENLR